MCRGCIDRPKMKSDLMALFLFPRHSCSHLNLCADSKTGWHIPVLSEHTVDVQRSPYTSSRGNRRDWAVENTGLLSFNSLMEKL